MKKKLLCLNVELLKAHEHERPAYAFRLPFPRLCSAIVTTKLIDTIYKAQRLIEENDLEEAAFRTVDVNWFSSLNDEIFQEIYSTLHITSRSIYFSGAFAPEKIPVFVSTRLPLSAIESSELTPKELNLSLLSSSLSQSIISDIENLERELEIAWDRQDSLESLAQSLCGLKPSSLIVRNSKTGNLAIEVSCEIKELKKKTEQLEHTIEEQCQYLCKEVLDISIGDRIVTQTKIDNKHIEIQITSIRYHDGTLFLDGIKVLKNGTLGKRTETAFVSLRSSDER